MTPKEGRRIREKIVDGVEAAIAAALERHKRLGESVAVWKDGKVVVLRPEQIPVRSRRRK